MLTPQPAGLDLGLELTYFADADHALCQSASNSKLGGTARETQEFTCFNDRFTSNGHQVNVNKIIAIFTHLKFTKIL